MKGHKKTIQKNIQTNIQNGTGRLKAIANRIGIVGRSTTGVVMSTKDKTQKDKSREIGCKLGFSLFVAALAVLSPIVSPTSVSAADSLERGVRELVELRHRDFMRAFHSGNPEAKVRAVNYLAGRKNPHYIRELGIELLKDLDKNSPNLRTPYADPYVKFHIVRGLGRSGYAETLYYLLPALKKTNEIIEFKRQRNMKLRKMWKKFADDMNAKTLAAGGYKSINDKAIPRMVIVPDRAGPAMYNRNVKMPLGPDSGWSVADEFKKYSAPNMADPYHRIRLEGYNYINLAVGILQTIEDLSRRKERLAFGAFVGLTDKLKGPFLGHRLPDVRAATALLFGRMGRSGKDGLKPLAALDERLVLEKDDEVRIKICHALMLTDRSRTKCYRSVIAALKNPVTHVRFAAARVFADIGYSEATPDLRRAYLLEQDMDLRRVLKQAMELSHLDRITPVYGE